MNINKIENIISSKLSNQFMVPDNTYNNMFQIILFFDVYVSMPDDFVPEKLFLLYKLACTYTEG